MDTQAHPCMDQNGLDGLRDIITFQPHMLCGRVAGTLTPCFQSPQFSGTSDSFEDLIYFVVRVCAPKSYIEDASQEIQKCHRPHPDENIQEASAPSVRQTLKDKVQEHLDCRGSNPSSTTCSRWLLGSSNNQHRQLGDHGSFLDRQWERAWDTVNPWGIWLLACGMLYEHGIQHWPLSRDCRSTVGTGVGRRSGQKLLMGDKNALGPDGGSSGIVPREH